MENNTEERINKLLNKKTLIKVIKIALECLVDEENIVGPKGLLILKSDKSKCTTLIYVIDKETEDFLICAELDNLHDDEYLFVEKEEGLLKKINNDW